MGSLRLSSTGDGMPTKRRKTTQEKKDAKARLQARKSLATSRCCGIHFLLHFAVGAKSMPLLVALFVQAERLYTCTHTGSSRGPPPSQPAFPADHPHAMDRQGGGPCKAHTRAAGVPRQRPQGAGAEMHSPTSPTCPGLYVSLEKEICASSC